MARHQENEEHEKRGDFEPVRFCGRCGRRLYGKAAIERGYGERCWQIVIGAMEPKRRELHIKHAKVLRTTERQ